MLKSIVLLSVIVLCQSADSGYQASIDHEMPTAADYDKARQGFEYKVVEVEDKSDEGINRRGYSMPSIDEYVSKTDNYESYSAPYGYERPSYEKKKSYEPIRYAMDTSYSQSYGQSYGPSQSYGQSQSYAPQYVEKSYSSPIHAQRRVEIKPIMTQAYPDQKDHLIDVKDDTPIVIHFRTHANRIKVEQTRIPDKPKEVEHTRSEDEPHRVIHEVYKPVIQEIREIIQPFRKVVQQVQPVVEEVQTVVHRGEGRRGSGGNGGNGGQGGEYGQRQSSYNNNKGYAKRSTEPNKKYNTLKEYLPQGSVMSARGVPVYKSQYKGPARPKAY